MFLTLISAEEPIPSDPFGVARIARSMKASSAMVKHTV